MGNPAARLGDPTAHGGVITVGCPTVLIGGMPAARIGDMHVCPMMTPCVPPIPHVGGPVMLGSPTVLIGGSPAARMGDMSMCVGPPSTIVMGCPTVLIGEGTGSGGGGGGGAAGTAKAGAYSALKGTPAEETKGQHWIEYQFVDSAGNPVTGVSYEFTNVDGNTEKGQLTKDGVVKRGGLPKSGNCSMKLIAITNAKWSKNKAKVGDVVKLSAELEGYEDGTKAVFEIFEHDLTGADYLVKKVETTVQGGKAESQWTYEYSDDSASRNSELDAQNSEPEGYSSPEHYFIVKIEGDKARSNQLKFHDWVGFELKDSEGKAIDNQDYVLYLRDGSIKKGKLDSKGSKKHEKLSLGNCKIKFHA